MALEVFLGLGDFLVQMESRGSGPARSKGEIGLQGPQGIKDLTANLEVRKTPFWRYYRLTLRSELL